MTDTCLKIAICGLWDSVNTARYFERAFSRDHTTTLIETPPGDMDIDLLVVVDPSFSSPRRLRNSRCPTVGILIDVHQEAWLRRAYARYFDHVFIAQLDFLKRFEALPHPSVTWLPLACEPELHFVPGLTRDIDVGFVGKMGYPGSDRLNTLSQVLAEFSTNDFRRHYTPEEMAGIYSRSKIVFNKSINDDVNMRFFEGLASGALLMTDRTGNGLAELATENVHFVGYDTADEAIKKISYYLSHEDERLAIAAAGQALAFQRHTYVARLHTILEIVHARPETRAPARTARPRQEIIWRSECLRIKGANLGEAIALLAEGHWTRVSIANTAAAAVRGLVRPIRQRFGW